MASTLAEVVWRLNLIGISLWSRRKQNPAKLAKASVKPDRVRLSIDIEYIDGLMTDLDQALALFKVAVDHGRGMCLLLNM